ncbi:MAG: patatin family protein [Evtepia sp.]|uniref:patatin-like phospholipase family protein n=1 Tax=Evtepia sp. TaxID=2773933 RepID=UPI002A752DCA|nr:patatin family protein [Evtepia sp.]MDY3015310.1 patatin family protein [Evtepia sp.]
MKHGLVLEGGAMRGLFTAGVTDVMMEEGLTFDGAVGVSAGAVFGCNYKSNQPGRVLRYNLRFCKDPRYCSMRSWAKTGDLFGADFCYREIPDHLDPFDREAYRSNPMDFYVVGTDVATGRPVYHNCTQGDQEDMDWFRGSASMPMASRVVEVGGYRLLDGGISDSIPLRYLESQGYEKNVVVLTQPIGYVKKRNKGLPLMRRVLKQYPQVVEAMARRHEMYNEITAYVREQERRGRVFVIRPEAALDISRVEHDREKIQKAYDHGRTVARKRLAALKEFLQDR